MSQIIDASILTHFASLEEIRDIRGKEHHTIALYAVISGAEVWEDMAEYGRAKQYWLSTFLALPSGIPCADTFGRVFARLDPDQMQICFVSWVKSISKLLGAEVIGIDGKTLRHSGGKGCGKAAIHLVSAWASANRPVLGRAQSR